jgi:hypothetical protein
MSTAGFQHGSIVTLSGLRSRPELNQSYAVVLKPGDNDEDSKLESAGRVKVTSFPRALALKAVCLRVLSETEVQQIDWSIADFALPGQSQNATISSMVQHSQLHLGNINKCDEFATTIWRVVSQGISMPPRRKLQAHVKSMILDNTLGHYIYVLGLDQIGHHLVLETRAGQARLYQSHVKTMVTHLGQQVGRIGFTGREWLTGKPDSGSTKLPKLLLEARRRWRVPGVLSRADLVTLLDDIFRLQSLARDMAFVMIQQLPQALRESHEKWWASVSARSANIIGGVVEWAQEIHDDDPANVSSAIEAGEIHVFNSSIYNGEPLRFRIPARLGMEFVRLYEQLVGITPIGAVFLKILMFVAWDQMSNADERISAAGWSIVACRIPH